MQINTSWAVIFIDEPRLIDTCHLGASDRWENILIRRWESQTALTVKLTSSRVNASTKLSSFQQMEKSEQILQAEWPTKFVRGNVQRLQLLRGIGDVHQDVSLASLHVWVFESNEEPSRGPQSLLFPGIIFHKTLLKHLIMKTSCDDPWSRWRTFVFRYSWRSCVLFALRGTF